ncbi:hypothetical protein [Mycobacteroides abscessus]|uniref:hypothetical protein n=1 Tax=Mycobacteroides abscessus TaxID=36809 RepID=UPI0010427E3F|nr:hypothetical protein [Mycobacteroides abscessus]
MKSILTTLMGGLVIITTIVMFPTLVSTMIRTGADVAGTTQTPAPGSPSPWRAQPSGPTDWTEILTAGGIILAIVAGGGLIFLAWRYLAKGRAGRTAKAARRAAQIALWERGIKALAETSEKLMAFETDPDAVYFTRRLLADVTEPATAAFYTAYGTAQNLCTATIPADTDMITAFVDAAGSAQRAFGIADENARRKARLGISHEGHKLTTDERRKIDQAQKLMRQAHDPAVGEENAHNALTKALSLLDGAGVIVPERLASNVTKSIASIHRRALTA